MNTNKDMEKNLIALLSRAILEKDADVPNRLSAQEASLRDLECIDPELGKWLVYDFPFLIETLLLSDAVFSEEFPGINLPAEERRNFANALEGHCEACSRCHLRRAYDLEFQLRVKRAFADNRAAAGQAIARAAGEK